MRVDSSNITADALATGKNQAGIAQRNHSQFWMLIVFLSAVLLVFYNRQPALIWLVFILAAYSAIANDSIQTLGTFIVSNRNRNWWVLWLFTGGILICVLVAGWWLNGGDIAYGRLSSIPESTRLTPIQVFAPVVLLIVTYYRVPVSTTFLLLSVFASNVIVGKMLQKTLIGYLLAFVCAIIVWAVITELIKHRRVLKESYNRSVWRVLQWASTGLLWSAWLMQDMANSAVYLPRTLNATEMLVVTGVLFGLLGVLMRYRGGRIQTIISEKSDIVDVRSATLIDFTLALLLWYFKMVNGIPMSTTFVFLGLLAGREFALTRLAANPQRYKRTLKLILKDLSFASAGLAISLSLAWASSWW